MNTYEIHFLMLILGILAGMFVAGRFRRASTRRNPYNKKVRHWPIGLATMLVVALSPFSRFIPSLPFDLTLLTQSFLFSALGLFIIMLFDTIIKSFRSRDEEPRYRASADLANTSSVQRQSYHDDAAPSTSQPDPIQTNQSHSTQLPHDSVTVDKSAENVSVIENTNIENTKLANSNGAAEATGFKLNSTIDESAVGEAVQSELSEKMTTAMRQADPIQDSLAEAKAELAEKAAMADVTDDINNLDSEFQATKESVQEIDLAVDAAEMDSIRNQLTEEVVLPTDNVWQETQGEFDLTQDVMPKEHASESNIELSADSIAIEDAEVVAEQSVNEFRNDITGDYDSPSYSTSAQSIAAEQTSDADEFNADMPAIPETLQDALKVSKESTEKLQTKIDTLDANLRQLTELQSSTAEMAQSRAEQMLERKQALVQSQDETQAAAESVIEVQTALLQRARRQHELVSLKLEQERKELAAQRVEILRTRAVAQKAALLARKASQAQQATRDIAKREQSARLASQEKARKAVLIARNAISALAEEERKRGLTRH